MEKKSLKISVHCKWNLKLDLLQPTLAGLYAQKHTHYEIEKEKWIWINTFLLTPVSPVQSPLRYSAFKL